MKRWKAPPQPGSRKTRAEAAALAQIAGDTQFGLMARQDVLDDRQPQSGAAGLARAPAIHAVEALGQARNVFRGDADTVVIDREVPATVHATPAQANASARRRVAH